MKRLLAFFVLAMVAIPLLPIETAEAGVATNFIIQVSKSNVEPYEVFSVFIEAVDSGGNRVTDYTGTVKIERSCLGTLPFATYTFTLADVGFANSDSFVNAFSLNVPGTQYLNFTDTANGIFKSQPLIIKNYYFDMDIPDFVFDDQTFSFSATVRLAETHEVFTGYKGTLYLSSQYLSSSNSPIQYFEATNAGVATVSMTLSDTTGGPYQGFQSYAISWIDNNNVGDSATVKVYTASTIPQLVFETTELVIMSNNPTDILFSVMHSDVSSGFVGFVATWERLVWIETLDFPDIEKNLEYSNGNVVVATDLGISNESLLSRGDILSYNGIDFFQIRPDFQIRPKGFFALISYTITETEDTCPWVNMSLSPTTFSGEAPHEFVLRFEPTTIYREDFVSLTINLYDADRGIIHSVYSEIAGDGTTTYFTVAEEDDIPSTQTLIPWGNPLFLPLLLGSIATISILVGMYVYKKQRK